MQASNQPSKIQIPFANSGNKQPIPIPSQIGTEDGRASFTDGFPPLTRTPLAAGGKPPFGTDMNGILFAVTQVQQWQSAGGLFSYDADMSTAIGGYPRGALLVKADGSGYWQSTVENNTSNPDTGGAGWSGLLSSGGTVGSSRRAAMRVTAASASSSLTADQLTVSVSLGGASYGLSAFNASINLATVGLGGMNTGVAPVNGWVAIYAIYNPTTGASGLLAIDSTSLVAPEIFAATGMPAGFTASALVAVWRTNASRLLIIGGLKGRSVSFPFTVVISVGSTVSALTAVNLASYVPPNAISCGGFMTSVGINTTNAQTNVASDTSGSGLYQLAGNSTTGSVQNISGAPFSDLKILTQQTIYWQTKATTGDYNGGAVYLSTYEF